VSSDVLVVIGVGGMGRAIARRQGPGRTTVLADFTEDALTDAADSLATEGHDVSVHRVDVSQLEQVADLATTAAALGPVTQVVHTAGLSPVQATASAILEVDLVGAAHVLEEFGRVIAPGGAGVVISSMAGHMGPPLTAAEEADLARVPATEILRLPIADPLTVTDAGAAYVLAKRAVQIRVQAAAVIWGERRARVNSISPGIVATPMGRQELTSESGELMRTMVEVSATGRLGTPDDIAAATAFLLGPDASFITGTDLLVDGGVVAGVRSGRLGLPG
jgi:NAD(P)-dependent dehydrogenase (short-subunit alcohol dehydrogenase family)